jgi:protein arginine N-methyltransferase 7
MLFDDDDDNFVVSFVPPGARANRDARFGEEFDENFKVPWRLADKSSDLVEAVNDFHFAMINDTPRNDFYRECLSVVKKHAYF